MQGIFINGSRPKSKKQIKELVIEAQAPNTKADLYGVVIEATSMFGNEYDGSLATMPKDNSPVYFVGPDPHSKRNFYGTIEWNDKKEIVHGLANGNDWLGILEQDRSLRVAAYGRESLKSFNPVRCNARQGLDHRRY